MALLDIREDVFPLRPQIIELIHALETMKAFKQFHCRGRRSRSHFEQGDCHFAAREGVIDGWKIRNEQRNKGQANRGFGEREQGRYKAIRRSRAESE